jgi:hypothetical protein
MIKKLKFLVVKEKRDGMFWITEVYETKAILEHRTQCLDDNNKFEIIKKEVTKEDFKKNYDIVLDLNSTDN